MTFGVGEIIVGFLVIGILAILFTTMKHRGFKSTSGGYNSYR